MNSDINNLNGAFTNEAAGESFTQSTHSNTKGKTNRIIIVIEDGRVVKYIQKTIKKN